MFSAVAAPNAFTVVAVVLASAKVVDGVVISVVTSMPTANGTFAVAVCEPSFSTQVESAVERSARSAAQSLESIAVPSTAGFQVEDGAL